MLNVSRGTSVYVRVLSLSASTSMSIYVHVHLFLIFTIPLDEVLPNPAELLLRAKTLKCLDT